MAIKYKIVTRKNPQDFEAAPKYYAQVVVDGKDSTQTLAQEIALSTTMGKADVIGVLTALGDIVGQHLAMGRNVDLLDLCILSPSITSTGAASEAEFNVKTNIKRVGVNIRAKRNLVEAVAKAGLQKA